MKQAKYIAEETIHDGGHEHRPRNLGVLEALFHLDADWGTSLAYTLALGLTLTGRLAPVYMIIIAGVMALVASGYKIVCRHNPEGGGVYTSLRHINKFLAVIGALLLITDYVVTEALSVSDAFHYLQFDHWLHSPVFSLVWTIGIIIGLGVINWRGPHFSAKFAGVASGATFVLAGILAIVALPLVPAGLANIGHFNQSIWEVLRNTTGVLLALSGVEAISNMTGIMKDPEKTSRRALNLELFKVVFTTVILGVAMNALPARVLFTGQTNQVKVMDVRCVFSGNCQTRSELGVKDDLLVEMGQFLVPGQAGKIYGGLIGLAYGLLLIFAGNTALIGITNITYTLAHDGELPKKFTKLNRKYGVPIWGLATAVMMPIGVVLIVGTNISALAALYAIGVVGAVAMNLAGTTTQVKGVERWITGSGALVMMILFITLALTKMQATVFATSVVCVGLMIRQLGKHINKHREKIEVRPAFAEVSS